LPCHKKAVYTLDWNCTGKYLASADNAIKIWNFENSALQKEKEYKGSHSDIVE
jgi:WD40 repeat protein